MATNEEIMSAVVAMREDVCGHLHRIEEHVQAHDSALSTLTDQVSTLTEAKRSTSMRTRQLSDADDEHHALLAHEKEAREALAKKVDAIDLKTDAQTVLLQQIVGVTKNKMVRQVAQAVGVAILTYLGMKGLR